MNIIDENSIRRIQGNLEGFHKANGHYNFRCPYCGDSAKSKLKKRGWLFDYKGRVFYKCFNCDKSTSYATFLQDWFPEEYTRYISDRAFLDPNKLQKIQQQSIIKCKITRDEFITLSGVFPTTEPNTAATYLDRRKVSNRDNFFYTPNYGQLLKLLKLDTYIHEYNCNEERLLIPHFNRNGYLAFLQMRVLNNSKIRYRTYKVIEDEYKLWNLDKVNLNKRVYVTEGALDASFLQNCVAMSGSDAQLEKSILGTVKDNIRLVFDNEPSSPIIAEKYLRAIRAGYHVFHWPNIKYKDINDCILADYNIVEKIYDDSNYFCGLLGEFDFLNWRRCDLPQKSYYKSKEHHVS